MALDPGTGSRRPKPQRKKRPKPTMRSAVESLLEGVSSVEHAGTDAVMDAVGEVNRAKKKKRPKKHKHSVLGSVGGFLGDLGKGVGHAVLDPVFELGNEAAYGRHGPSASGQVPPQARAVGQAAKTYTDFYLGPTIGPRIMGDKVSGKGLALDVALAGLLPFGPAGATERALRMGAEGARIGETAAHAAGELERFHAFPEEKVARNLRLKLNPRNAELGLPQNPKVFRKGPQSKRIQLIGPITPEQWAKRVETVMPTRAERQKWAEWYPEVLPLFREVFGEDAEAILRGFAVSQANASPATGLTAVLRVWDKVKRGIPVKANEISTVAKSIEAATQGRVVEEGVAAKLSDFIDSLRNSPSRTWMGNDPRGGAPAAIDIHSLRDTGYVDPKLITRLRDRYGLEEGKHYIVDTGGVANGNRYERAAEKYAQITDHLNRVGFDGRHDWTPAEVQAVGWAAIQKVHGVDPEDLHFAVGRNTTNVSLEVLEGTSDKGSSLSYEAKQAVTQEVVDQILPKLVEEENAFLRGISYGPGGYLDNIAPSAQIQIVAAPEQVDRIVGRLARMFDQYEVWGVRAGVTISPRPGAGIGKAAVEISANDFADPKRVEAFWNRLRELAPEGMQRHLQGFAPFTRPDGMPSIRVVTDSGPQAAAKANRWLDQFAEHLEQAAQDVDLHGAFDYNSTNVEIRKGVHGAAEDHASAAPGGAAGGPGGVGDQLEAQARALLGDSLRRHGEDPLRRVEQADQLQAGLPGERFGEVAARPKRVAPGAPEGAEEIMGAIGPARRLGREQEALRREERGRRIGEVEAAIEDVGGGEAGFRAGRAALRGKYPEIEFHKLFDSFGEPGSPVRANLQAKVDDILDFIDEHPALEGKRFTKENTKEAFLKAINGQLPTKSEVRLLEKVFGEESVKPITRWRRLADLAVSLMNVPRSLRASYDLSAPFRQGLVLGARHPVLFARAWKPMLKAAKSKAFHDAVEAEIRARPSYDLMKRGGLKLTDFENISTREEAYMSDLAERIPIVGRGVKFSARAYVTFLNKLRADAFDLYLEHLGPDFHELSPARQEEELKSIASWINTATGRGGMGSQSLEKAAPFLTTLLFSPRLIASRLSLMNPVYYARLSPFARKQAARGVLNLVGAGTATLFLAQQLGAEVVMDPRNSDFGKIKLGTTRIDIWGGFQQYVVNGYRVAVGESVSSTTGKVKKLEGGFGKESRYDILTEFGAGKAAPIPAYAIGSLKGKKPSGEEFNEAKEAAHLFIPLGFENTYEGFTAPGGGPAYGALSGVLGSIGFGTQTYGNQPSKSSSRRRGKPGRSSSSRPSRPKP